jgi:Ca2+-binding EF-hand superfamily protein
LKANALNQLPLKEHLAKYSGVFSKDLDDMWKEKDSDGNGYLNQEEAKAFLEEATKVVDKEKGQYYFPANFDALFKKFDIDGDKILTKAEMAAFIKKAYRK